MSLRRSSQPSAVDDRRGAWLRPDAEEPAWRSASFEQNFCPPAQGAETTSRPWA